MDVFECGHAAVPAPLFSSINDSSYWGEDVTLEWCFGNQGAKDSWRIMLTFSNTPYVIFTSHKESVIISQDLDDPHQLDWDPVTFLKNALIFAEDNPGEVPTCYQILQLP